MTAGPSILLCFSNNPLVRDAHAVSQHNYFSLAHGCYDFGMNNTKRNGTEQAVVPVQRATDFMVGSAGSDVGLPSSSYRLGVRAGPLHEVRFRPEGI